MGSASSRSRKVVIGGNSPSMVTSLAWMRRPVASFESFKALKFDLGTRKPFTRALLRLAKARQTLNVANDRQEIFFAFACGEDGRVTLPQTGSKRSRNACFSDRAFMDLRHAFTPAMLGG
jgi:hypothetical protein